MLRSGKRPWELRESETTAEHWMWSRRSHLAAIAGAALAWPASYSVRAARAEPLSEPALHAAGEQLTTLADASSYNNYYEFSSDKKAVKVLAQALTLRPWSITVEGEVERPYTVDADDLVHLFGIEERIYRLRCVEGWSLVVPWSGFKLERLLERARPTSRARYVAFESLRRSGEMVGQRGGALPWPYREGLRIDEAMHPLAFAVTGLYGHPLPPQNGAPLRLAIPWKYGFKSAKAITRIRLMEQQPATSWNQWAPSEYGFYGNVNPQQPHPRWSQARENRIGELQKRATLPFNGYAEWVASPAASLGIDYLNEALGANPLETLLHTTGRSALVLLALTLSITPLRRGSARIAIVMKERFGKRMSDWNWLIRLRRPLGLWCCAYATAHAWIFARFDLNYDWAAALVEIREKPYILAGLCALLLLLLLALTSPTAMVRMLGRHWRRLHRLVYAAAVLALLHFWWLVKPGLWTPWPDTLVLALLLGYRAALHGGLLERWDGYDGRESAPRPPGLQLQPTLMDREPAT